MFGPQYPITRRQALQTVSAGFGYLALAGLTTEAAAAQYRNPLSPRTPHFTPRAKHIIYLCMRGGPSHVDTFDYKPQLAVDEGKSAAGVVGRGKARTYLPSPFKFKQHGQSGLWISDLFPEVAKHADDLCLVNSMYTDVPNHPQAFLMMHTGAFRVARPSMGAWLLYGLGTGNQDLPGFVTINPPSDLGGAQNYGSAFLPAIYQGTRTGIQGNPIGNLHNGHLSPDQQRRQLDLVQSMNRDLLGRRPGELELEGVIESMELAFRMQRALPDVMDLSRESRATLDRYGIGKGGNGGSGKKGNKAAGVGTDNFGRQCLMARRLVEAGVRYVELGHTNWDQHGNLTRGLTNNAGAIDQPIGALLTDLKQRGLLKDTLVMWGGEFGRTPTAQRPDGRDHNATGFSMWLTGGGIKGGRRYGSTDEHGTAAVDKRVHVHDLHATLLHLMGLDHTKLTYRYAGRDFRLTDVHGNVLKDLIG
jgi:hypothetical protein